MRMEDIKSLSMLARGCDVMEAFSPERVVRVRKTVFRQERVVIEYYTEDWELVEETYTGLAARVIQHEYDHIEGVLFTEKIKPLRKRLIKGALGRIERGGISPDYPMKFPKAK